jgi:two-component system copper resistance phosphate regulon response regulator CusR
MLPKIDGFQVCKILREKGINIPVLMLTAKDTTKDKVKGLDIGADDYLAKPFEIEELLARVRALIRRNSASKTDIYKIGNYTFNLSAKTAEKNGKKIELSQKLFCILEQLLRNRGKVVSYESLMNKCWDINDYPTKETVRAHIKLLRKALEDKDLIQNVSGIGYKIE